MTFCILFGSPRPGGNTAALLSPFTDELKAAGAEVELFPLAKMEVAPCLGCRCCQRVAGEYGCAIRDDMHDIVAAVRRCDALVLATPIYCWFCSAQLKTAVDRFFGMSKFDLDAPSLWNRQVLGLLATHADEARDVVGPFAGAMGDFARFNGLPYLGLYSARADDSRSRGAEEGARAFARRLLAACEKKNRRAICREV